MIEKLEIPKTINWDDTDDSFIKRHIIITNAYEKINELVDAVNNLQTSNSHIQKDLYEMRHPEAKVDLTELAKKAEKECRFNPVRADREVYKALTSVENVQDKFVEQRKWIGKLCRFRDKDYKDDQWDYGLLQAVEKAETAHIWKTGCFKHNLGHWYDFCEPVKPTDSIIYKGGDNE